jgi:hypothetical protein
MVALSRLGLPKKKPRGKPFPKGVSGNLKGKPKGAVQVAPTITDVRLLARVEGPEAIRKLTAIMKNEAATHMAQIAAASQLLDRGWGRPPQAVELTGAEGGPIQIMEVDPLDVIRSRLASIAERLREGERTPRLQ